MITREWLQEQIVKLSDELSTAYRQQGKALRGLDAAQQQYNEARGTAEALEGCIRGLKDELERLERTEKEDRS
jgi:chromosome segregation ATPase